MGSRNITDLGIKALRPKAERYEKPAGNNLYVVVQPSGRKSFAVRYRHAGKTHKLTLPGGISLAAARSSLPTRSSSSSKAMSQVRNGAGRDTRSGLRRRIRFRPLPRSISGGKGRDCAAPMTGAARCSAWFIRRLASGRSSTSGAARSSACWTGSRRAAAQ